MRPPLGERIRPALCRRFGHREESDAYVVSCRRCRLLLRPVKRRP